MAPAFVFYFPVITIIIIIIALVAVVIILLSRWRCSSLASLSPSACRNHGGRVESFVDSFLVSSFAWLDWLRYRACANAPVVVAYNVFVVAMPVSVSLSLSPLWRFLLLVGWLVGSFVRSFGCSSARCCRYYRHRHRAHCCSLVFLVDRLQLSRPTNRPSGFCLGCYCVFAFADFRASGNGNNSGGATVTTAATMFSTVPAAAAAAAAAAAVAAAAAAAADAFNDRIVCSSSVRGRRCCQRRNNNDGLHSDWPR